MGRLVQLELENFKSYQGHQVIGPFRDFTCIIGPNGSGKSNLMDAISFVLGVKSSQLRSSHLKELLYRSNATGGVSQDENGDALAEESSMDEDNPLLDANGVQQANAAYVMAVYEKSDGTRLLFKRSINASGVSEYSIDGKTMPYNKYNKVLEEQNILVKARNFLVFQGDVEAIASQSPRELTKLIEQISGSEELKAEYEKLREEQDLATENSTFNFNKKRGINAEIKQFKEQKKEADHFEELLEQRANLIITHILWRLYHIEQDLGKLATNVSKQTDTLTKHGSEQAALEESLKTLRKEQAQLHKECMKLEKQQSKFHKDLDQRKPELVKLNEQLGHLERKIKTHKEAQAKVQQDMDKQSTEIQDMESQMSNLEKAEQRFEASADAQEKKSTIKLSSKQKDLYRETRAKVDQIIFKEKQQFDDLSRQLRTESDQVARFEEKLDEFQEQRNKLDQDHSLYAERKEKLTASIKQVDEDAGKVKERMAENTAERKRIDKLEKEHEERLADVYQQLTQARHDKRESEHTARLRDAIETMRRIFPGVHGRVVDLCKPMQKKYSVALSVVLGKNMDAIVVDESKCAIDCIQYLKDQEIGLATFLPLDSIQSKPANEKYRSFAKGTRLAIDCIQYDPSLDRVFSYVCGNALICDTLDVARHVCYDLGQKVKAVTLDGTIIHKAGLITGGQSDKMQQSSQMWEEKEVENLHKMKDQLEAELAELSRSRRKLHSDEALTTELFGLENRKTILSDDLSATLRKLESIDVERKHINVELADWKKRNATAAKTVAKIESERNKVDAEIQRAEHEAFQDLCAALRIESIREYESDQLKWTQEAAEKRLQFATQKSRLQNELSFARDQLAKLQERMEKLQETLTSETEALDEVKKKKLEHVSVAESWNQELSTLTEQYQQAKKDEDAKNGECNRVKRQLAEQTRTLDQLKRDISGKESLIEKLHYERNDILRKCKLEEIALPLKEGSLEEIPLAESKTSQEDGDSMDVDSQDSSLASGSQQFHSIVVDYSEFDDELKKNASEAVENKFQDSVRALAAEIERMAPNMKAIDRLDGVETRLKQTADEFERARQQAKTLKEKYNAVKQRRFALFNKAFQHISQRIDKIYKELTRTPTHPLGGTAYLTLENNEEPYLEGVKFHAMPPMKRFRDMEQLSGGEKTVAALALLFAIHSFHPSPFFVLDEVDAALDNANVAKVASYIRTHANDHFQFIVISLKNSLYEKSEALVGIYRDQEAKGSRVLTLDLTKYEE